MDLVEIGKITRPHGFRGALVVLAHSGHQSALGNLKEVFVGASPDRTVSYPLLDSAWMPRGWKIRLQGLESDLEVRKLQGALVFADRAALPAPAEGEYYISDLVGARVLDAGTGTAIGTFAGVESAGQDRWWIEGREGLFPIPAAKHYIRRVDMMAREIWLQNLDDLK